MLEVLREAISGPTLPFTILLGLILLYWSLIGLGMFHLGGDGADSGHADLSGHGHLHDGGAHGHGDHGADGAEHSDGHDGGFFKPLLAFFNVGEVPITLVVSVLAVLLWVSSMFLNHYLNPAHDDTRALILLAPNLLITCIGTSLATRPFKKLFRTLNRDFDQQTPVLGQRCVISTSEATERFGQAVVERPGAPLLINVRTFGGLVLQKGEEALIIKEDAETQIYTVAKLAPQNPQLEQQEKQLC
jgi:hypothetical protein